MELQREEGRSIRQDFSEVKQRDLIERENKMGAILKRWKTEVLNFTEDTTAHGLGRVGKEHRPIWYRLIWLTIALSGMAVAVFNCDERFRHYLAHPFQIVQTFEPQASIPFPSVTVCSAFPLPVLGQASVETRKAIDNVKQSMCYNISAEREHISELIGATEEALLFSVMDGNITNLGFSSQSLIAKCRFDHKKCTTKNFTRYVDTDFFNCYTFDTKELASNNKELTLLLYLSTNGKAYNYSDVLEFYTAGAYVQIHQPNVLPSPRKVGRALLPGTYSLMSLSTYKTHLLAAPVATNCTNSSLSSTSYKYDVDICYKVCLQRMMVELCGCAYAGIHMEKPPHYSGPFCLHNYCNKTLLTLQTRCIMDFYSNLDLNSNCLDCEMPPCVSWGYKDHHSMLDYFANFPAYDFADDFLELDHPARADMIDAYSTLANVPNDFISKNFAKVTITFSDLHVRHRSAETTMSGFSLFSDLGGAFGFWIGFSIMTFIEIIEWLIRMVISTMRPKQVNNQISKDLQ